MLRKILFFTTASALVACGPKWHEEALTNGVQAVIIENGPTLGYSLNSGVQILEVDGLPFKDLDKDGELDAYEDWRLSVDERAKDLASQLSEEEIAGLMLYSRHQPVPAPPVGYFNGTYSGGLSLDSAGVPHSALTDQQIKFLTEDQIRHVLLVSVESPKIAAEWNNNVQSLTESLGHGIPANNSSDPRHGANKSAEYNAGSGGSISQWPEQIGLAATFDTNITYQFGNIASQEYRALGIATALSPQIDLATEPRWNRFFGTFGGHPVLATEMARAYVDGFQSSGADGGWGMESVNAMVKHWPSGGPEEGGRDGHFAFGKFAVYPGGHFNTHLRPFIDGAFKLNGKTGKASAVMPYYTISYNQDTVYDENVGNGFSKYIITDLLRNKYGYDGVACTDWRIIGDEGAHPGIFGGKPWGTEELDNPLRHLKSLMAGMDQFGGNNEAGPVLEAFAMMRQDMGGEWARERLEQSAVRLLRNIFQVGLFENPYLDPAVSETIVGKPEFMEAGYEAQLKSITMLKNSDSILPIKERKTVYVPQIHVPSTLNFFGMRTEAYDHYPIELDILRKDFDITDNPEEADFAIAFVNSPNSPGYDYTDRESGGNGYLPISLQHADYVAENARAQSIAAGDPVVDPTITNRSYKGKTALSNQRYDLPMMQDLREKMGDKPITLVMTVRNPVVFAQMEPLVDGILLDFGVQTAAIMDIITGRQEPSGLLPMQMPASMEEVELQLEDVPMDMMPYIDADDHAYDFAFGMNWSGVICDERTQRYFGMEQDW